MRLFVWTGVIMCQAHGLQYDINHRRKIMILSMSQQPKPQKILNVGKTAYGKKKYSKTHACARTHETRRPSEVTSMFLTSVNPECISSTLE